MIQSRKTKRGKVLDKKIKKLKKKLMGMSGGEVFIKIVLIEHWHFVSKKESATSEPYNDYFICVIYFIFRQI